MGKWPEENRLLRWFDVLGNIWVLRKLGVVVSRQTLLVRLIIEAFCSYLNYLIVRNIIRQNIFIENRDSEPRVLKCHMSKSLVIRLRMVAFNINHYLLIYHNCPLSSNCRFVIIIVFLFWGLGVGLTNILIIKILCFKLLCYGLHFLKKKKFWVAKSVMQILCDA